MQSTDFQFVTLTQTLTNVLLEAMAVSVVHQFV